MGIPVWFVCKLCKGSFGKIHQFIEHKLEKHFHDFLQTKHIIFEEAADDATLAVPTSTPTYFFLQPTNTDDVGATTESSSVTENTVTSTPENGQQPSVFELQSTESDTLNLDHSFDSSKNTDIFVDDAETSSDFLPIPPPASHDSENSIIDEVSQNVEISKNELMYDAQNSISIELDSGSNFVDSDIQNQCLKGDITQTECAKGKYLFCDSSASSIIRTEINLQCDICKKRFDSEPLLKIHVTICKLYNSKKAPCEKRTSETETELEPNSKSTKKTDNYTSLAYKCTMCVKEFRHPQSLRKHIIIKHNGGPLKCPNPGCNRAYTIKKYLDSHSAKCESLASCKND